jgi:molecular chaperone Hsp33
LGQQDAMSLVEEEGNIEVACEFCNEHYYFDKNEVVFIFSDNSEGSVFNSETVH